MIPQKIRDRIDHFKNHWFVRNVATLQAGDFAGNIIQALIGVLIARLLQPELFGIYTLSLSLAGLLLVFLGIGAHDAVTTILGGTYAKKDKKGTRDALTFLFKITIITGILSFVGIFLAPWIAKVFYGNYKIGIYAAIMIGVSIISTSFFSFLLIVLQVLRRIKAMTILGLTGRLTRSGLSLLFVFFGFGVLGAVAGHLIGTIIFFFISVVIWETIRKKHDIFPSVRKLLKDVYRAKVKKYLGFSIWITADKNIASLYGILPLILTGIFVSTSEVTFFKLAFAYTNLAVSLIGPISVLLNVEFPRMKVEGGDKLVKNFIKISLYSLGLSTLFTAGAVIVAPIAFKFFYGVSFMPSVKYVFGLFVYGAFMGIGVGLGPMWRAINKVKISILINTIVLGIGIPAGMILIKYYGIWGAVIMVTAWYLVSISASFIYLSRYLSKKGRHLKQFS